LSQRSRRLLEEAIKDLEISCYNKATSASYFAVRMLAEEILRQLGEQIPRRDDKLANAIKSKGLRWEATAMVILYALRKKADYEAGVTREEAELAVKLSMEVHKYLKDTLEEIRGRRG
jgi:HEPN domain-containing protein